MATSTPTPTRPLPARWVYPRIRRRRLRLEPWRTGGALAFRKKKKKKKAKGLSRNLRPLQRAENDVSRAVKRAIQQARGVSGDPFTEAFWVAASGYRGRRRKSARKRRDGALVDYIANYFDSTVDGFGVVIPPIQSFTAWITPTPFRAELVRQSQDVMRFVAAPWR